MILINVESMAPKGASIYDIRTEREGVKKYTKFADKQHGFCGLRGGGGQKIPKCCGRLIWKPPDDIYLCSTPPAVWST